MNQQLVAKQKKDIDVHVGLRDKLIVYASEEKS